MILSLSLRKRPPLPRMTHSVLKPAAFCGNRLCRKSLNEGSAPEKNLSIKLAMGRMNFVLLKMFLTVFENKAKTRKKFRKL